MKTTALVRCLVLILALSANWSLHAASIQVRQECGLYFSECTLGLVVHTLTQNGPAENYSPGEAPVPIFSLAYVGNSFVMTALYPNHVATDTQHYGHLYGLDVYMGGRPIIGRMEPPCDPVLYPECVPSTSLGFVSSDGFPTDPAHPFVMALPAVPEPASGALALIGLAVVLGLGRCRLHRARAGQVVRLLGGGP